MSKWKATTMLPGSQPLAEPGERTGSSLSGAMIDRLHANLDRRTARSIQERAARWQRDLTSAAAYARSVAPNRAHLAQILGVVDPRLPTDVVQFTNAGEPLEIAATADYRVTQLRWAVLDGIYGEGLLLTPRGQVTARVVALPDADQTPEQLVGLAEGIAPGSQFARHLAENGCQVVVPTLVSRACAFSCHPVIGSTNQPHREWLYRQAFEMGRHIIGYEVQKVLALVDWFTHTSHEAVPVGVAGYGEGGLLAFYAAALDPRIGAALVSGYFGPREQLWEEPVYRNVWRLLREFGDAEIASLIEPRGLVVEYATEPQVCFPALTLEQCVEQKSTAAPGRLATPSFDSVRDEFARIDALVPAESACRELISGPDGAPVPFGSMQSLKPFCQLLGVRYAGHAPGAAPVDRRRAVDLQAWQERQVREIERHVQRAVRTSDRLRQESFWDRIHQRSLPEYVEDAKRYRRQMWEDLIGRLEEPQQDAHPRARQVYDEELWVGYRVILDVWEDVFTWGILCVPRDVTPGERRPVVVCQHGYGGKPDDVVAGPADGAYARFAAQLAERGFITFAPNNPYGTEYHSIQLQRKANPLGLSRGSFILSFHTQVLNWLASLPFVDRERIGFYGLSYGGWTAVRVPPLLEAYCLSICSANFNDWIRKVAGVDFGNNYLATRDFDMAEWNAGHTFNHAEMAALMIPRPFMVERGIHDGVAPDSWVASEYAKVCRLYVQLGISDRTEIEVFDGGHVIHGQGAFDFLHKHLRWPKPPERDAGQSALR